MKGAFTLVTGASGGIGAALAMEFAMHGHPLILVSRNMKKLAAKRDEIKNRCGVVAEAYACDVSETAEIDGLLGWLKERRYTVGVLVNNAGIGYWGKFAAEDPEQIKRMLGLNVLGLTYLTRRIVDLMKGRNGIILNVASAAALIPPPAMVAAYAASKRYVRYFSEALAYELREENVLVSVLYPPDVATGFQKEAGAAESFSLKPGAMTAKAVAAIAYRRLAAGKRKIVPRKAFDAIQDRLCCLLPRGVYHRLVSGMVKKRIAR